MAASLDLQLLQEEQHLHNQQAVAAVVVVACAAGITVADKWTAVAEQPAHIELVVHRPHRPKRVVDASCIHPFVEQLQDVDVVVVALAAAAAAAGAGYCAGIGYKAVFDSTHRRSC